MPDDSGEFGVIRAEIPRGNWGSGWMRPVIVGTQAKAIFVIIEK
jgi:hypothetical protein